jgi:hypothetical protein
MKYSAMDQIIACTFTSMIYYFSDIPFADLEIFTG